MALTPGTRIGPYEITAPLGAGGMGEVYRARDTKLGRDVALKILPKAFSADAERVARFDREARALAALNHAHIAQIYGFDQTSDISALAMELVEGEDLAQRLMRGPIPFDEALPIAREIAEALEAAHERGIIHRDLKPANVKVRDDGTVKVLDFGLAKALSPEGANTTVDVLNSPTITSPAAMTAHGVILGTAAYMAPEQARGKPVDKRADIWAFGCVFYEMLTGQRAFKGEDVTDTLAAIVRADPDWSPWPAGVPDAIRHLVDGCLKKDVRGRIRDVSVVRYLLDQPASGASLVQAPPSRGAERTAKTWLTVGLATFLLGGALTAGAFLVRGRAVPQTGGPVVRLVTVPEPSAFYSSGLPRTLAVSPDGSYLVYMARSQATTSLAMRLVNRLESVVLEDTVGANQPFVSPDGKWIGFFVGNQIRRIPASGGAPTTVCRFAGSSRGGTWGEDGTIVFATTIGGLMRVPASGGEPVKVTSLEGPGSLHAFPSFLPGGKAVLFTSMPDGYTGAQAHTAVVDLASGAVTTLLQGWGSAPQYADTGHILTSSLGELRATPFDLAALKVTGDTATVGTGVHFNRYGVGNFGVSRTGLLVYVPTQSGGEAADRRALVWVDRRGVETPLDAPPRRYEIARLSPDGRRVAVDVRDGENDIWIWELSRKTLTRLTFGRPDDMAPLWSPDGMDVLYSSNVGGVPNIYRRRADGTGEPRRLTDTTIAQLATSVTPDGSLAALTRVTETGAQIAVVPLRELQPLKDQRVIITGPEGCAGGEISPDGRWIAYASNESGRSEIYVRPFPDVDAGRWQISNGGGSRPAWAPNGRELFYLDTDGLLTGVPIVSPGAAFSAGTPMQILRTKYVLGASARGLALRAYDVSRDGQRFLMIKDPSVADAAPEAVPLVFVTNWFEELKALAPSR